MTDPVDIAAALREARQTLDSGLTAPATEADSVEVANRARCFRLFSALHRLRILYLSGARYIEVEALGTELGKVIREKWDWKPEQIGTTPEEVENAAYLCAMKASGR